ncbi:MAG: glyoxylate/hydroxypyruvate reductase A [Sneathiella sp.]|nr:glyoxylate/hydroxypyruvate reductase A [Sneathiella sp.]
MVLAFVGQISEEEMDGWISRLSKLLPDETIKPFAKMSADEKEAADIAIVANPNPAEIEALPNVKWIHSVWAGVERMMAELAGVTVPIVRLTDPELSRTMAEAALVWVYYLHRDMPHYRKAQSEKVWAPVDYFKPSQKQVTLLGMGALGSAAAERLKDAGFKVAGWSRRPKIIEGVECYHDESGLLEVLAKTDYLVCLLPLTPETRGLLNKEKLSLLPKGAGVINFARGAIINDADLMALLDQGHISHAVLDVFMTEPLPAENPYWSHPSVTVLPHISAPTDSETASQIVAGNIVSYRQSGEIPPSVNRNDGY